MKLSVLWVKDIHQQLFPPYFLLTLQYLLVTGATLVWWWHSVMGWHGWAGCSQLRWARGWKQRRRRRAQDRTPGLQPSQPGTNPHHTAILGNPGTQTLKLVPDIECFYESPCILQLSFVVVDTSFHLICFLGWNVKKSLKRYSKLSCEFSCWVHHKNI